MTDSTKTLIAALLDRSGSMAVSKDATEDGWRALIADQLTQPGGCAVTLAQFDTEYEVVYPPTDIAAVPEFVLNPRGGTALLDAAGRFITEVGQGLSALPESERPARVICLIITDGHENASREWDWAAVNALITQQRDVYKWEFVFLGANIDAVEVGARIGVDRGDSLTFSDKDYARNRRAYAITSAKLGRKRREADFGFTAAERGEASGE